MGNDKRESTALLIIINKRRNEKKKRKFTLKRSFVVRNWIPGMKCNQTGNPLLFQIKEDGQVFMICVNLERNLCQNSATLEQILHGHSLNDTICQLPLPSLHMAFITKVSSCPRYIFNNLVIIGRKKEIEFQNFRQDCTILFQRENYKTMKETNKWNMLHQKKRKWQGNKPIVPFSTCIWSNSQMHHKTSFLHCLHKPHQVKPALEVVLKKKKKRVNK